MLVARRVLLAALAAVLLAAAAFAADATGTQPSPTPAPSPAEQQKPAPAEPIAPVMPETVVRPALESAPAIPVPPAPTKPGKVTFGNHGEIVVGAPATESRWKGSPISLSLRDAPLDEVLRTFARLANFNLVIQPGVHGTVTCELHDVPWDQALYVILKTQGLGAEIDGNVWMVEK